MKTASSIAQAIVAANLTRDDLNQIIAAINTKNRLLGAVAQAAFRKGSRVEFVNRRTGLTVTGKVEKLMPKNVKVLADNGVMWTVSPQLLRAGK